MDIALFFTATYREHEFARRKKCMKEIHLKQLFIPHGRQKEKVNSTNAINAATAASAPITSGSAPTAVRLVQTAARSAAQAEKLKGEAEAEYMRILAEAYNSAEKQEFYEFYRSLDALKAALNGGKKVVILPAESDIAKILMGN